MMSLPFSAVRVLDASQGYAGPYCGMLLAQHGAQVTKVEPPEGDWIRGMGTRHGEHTAIDLAVNRGAGEPRGDWPAVGGHGPQVLRAAGWSESEIDALVAEGTVVLPKSPVNDPARQ